ncbi:MAG: hypothetical protein AB7V13_14575 [Pseudorhodoplanes sp.]|uniref:hypothetical protein n=1 Tax=Pseudorhodoplanes sp. TaxID=1934341 RepID=UPI003D118766
MLANHHAPASNDSPQGDSNYDSILAALTATARGRAFLQEFALRNRAAETAALLSAIRRIEDLLIARSLEPGEAAVAGPLAAAASQIAGASKIEAPPAADESGGAVQHARRSGSRFDNRTPDEASPPASAAEVGVKAISEPAHVATHPVCDPFADICALSADEKIALFT